MITASRNELRHLVWVHLRFRPAASLTKLELWALLSFEVTTTKPNDVNRMRKELMAHVALHRERLSLPCDGNCTLHHDGVVLACHQLLLEDKQHGS